MPDPRLDPDGLPDPLRDTVSRRRYERAERARRTAERLLEEKSRALFRANQKLAAQAQDLEDRIARRTRELEQSRREAEAANKAKSDFLATMSHEIRTPINGMLGMAQVLKETRLDTDQAESVDVILNSGTVLTRIINDILDLAKIDAGKMDIEKKRISIADIVRDAAQLLDTPARDQGLSLTCDIPADLPDLAGDGLRLRQVLYNLLSNAIKFTEEGSVRVAAHLCVPDAVHADVTISVIDTGIGIPADRQKDLFQPFHQIDGSIARRFEGTGLGLVIARKLIELMGGTITLDSTIGQGSTFSIHLRLPLAAQEVANGERDNTDRAIALINARRPRILAADDNRANRLVLKSMLKSLDIELVEASDGTEAVERALAEPFDLFILDIQMPGLSGLDVLAHARRAATGRTPTPAIAMSANAMTEQTRDYLSAGFDAAVPKPVKKPDLIAAMADLLTA